MKGDPRSGHSKLPMGTTQGVINYMFAPILNMQWQALLRAGWGDFIPKLKAYIVFRMGPSITHPCRVDDIRDPQGGLGSCPYLAKIITRRE